MVTPDARTYLRRFRLNPKCSLAPDDLLSLAQWYSTCGDARSALGCIYLYTAIKHPPPSDCPATVELGRAVLQQWLEARQGEGIV